MDDLDLHLALEALRTNPAAHVYHERITRGMQAIEQGTLTPFERNALHRLLARLPVSTPPAADPVAALIAAFQDKLPDHDPTALATAIQQALAQRPATLNGAPVTITMDGDTQAHQANLAIGNQVGGNLVQVTVTIPIPDARFDALLASALRTHEQHKTRERLINAAQQIESDRLLNLRLQGFVGRVAELAAIREHIATIRPTGGYILIKAAAGEGKSSSIAKLIQEAGIAQTPHHFIALTTGREYQLGLLRVVVAQLILKHSLTVSYFPEESYPAMKGEFARILDELSKHGIEETIYLDGLDQLQPEIDGSRDLSFLPPQPPPGIVIVLGSRPDETLKPLEILHRVDYELPPLSEMDALALWRSVQSSVADSLLHDLYTALKGNALFVHLAADTMKGQSVIDATSLIRQIEQNPSNLFGITLERIKGRSLADWRAIWKPMLALLLVAQEPVRLDVLGDLLEQDHDTMQDAVWVLGGLVSQGIDQRVALHHLLFRDYLAALVFNQREVKRWHQELADWCAKDLEVIWADDRDPIEQARRMYARHHYIAHLFLAENWPTLWQVLDAGDYGEQKTRFDPSTRLYALDLDRGRESAIKAGQSTEEQIQHLPRLWKYSLLRTSLADHIERWIDDMFVVLAMLGRTHEAIERIEQCSNPMQQANLWSQIIEWCNTDQQTKILYRLQQSMSIADPKNHASVLIHLAQAYVAINNHDQAITSLEEAEICTKKITNETTRVETLINIAQIYSSLHHHKQAALILEQAQSIPQTIDHLDKRMAITVCIAKAHASFGNIDLALSLAKTILIAQDQAYILALIGHTQVSFGENEQAATTLGRARNIVDAIDDDWLSYNAHAAIAAGYAMIHDFDQAVSVAHTIPDPWVQADALFGIASVYISAGDFEQAITIAHSLQDEWLHTKTFTAIAATAHAAGNFEQATKYLIQATTVIQRWQHADAYWLRIHNVNKIAQTAIMAMGKEQALSLLETIYTRAQSNQEVTFNKVMVLIDIAKSYTIIGSTKQTIAILEQTYEMTNILHPGYEASVSTELVQIYALMGNIERAVAIAETIDDTERYAYALVAIVQGYVSQGNIERAVAIAETIDNPEHYAQALIILTQAYMRMHQEDSAASFLEKATTVTVTINDPQHKTAMLSIIAAIEMLRGNSSKATHIFEMATELAYSIRSAQSRAEALIAIIEKYQNNHDHVLSMIKATWNSVKANNELWHVLPLITPLLETHVWLVEQILEEEEWVNDQLERLG
ncbi:tetratricopeptide repeat protein [Herpetosiphon giganteus]|uniref:tetratricopeptide repeat protein n=1 Tax=Herpetosiphon giganteus TaxID=2029754 RepID=UPI001EF7B901|nr:tetratricopeptide repeat protein [Herpetosiphon giganteus]MBM7846632.1 tetratricopeptide (TPR) repeat protein [Herpetosiphon giganteus]